jgi:formate dehydrogenase assembly factor FdhD
VSSIKATNTSSEVDEAIAIDIFDHCAIGLSDEDWGSVIGGVHDSGLATLHQGLRARARDVGAESNSRHNAVLGSQFSVNYPGFLRLAEN